MKFFEAVHVCTILGNIGLSDQLVSDQKQLKGKTQ